MWRRHKSLGSILSVADVTEKDWKWGQWLEEVCHRGAGPSWVCACTHHLGILKTQVPIQPVWEGGEPPPLWQAPSWSQGCSSGVYAVSSHVNPDCPSEFCGPWAFPQAAWLCFVPSLTPTPWLPFQNFISSSHLFPHTMEYLIRVSAATSLSLLLALSCISKLNYFEKKGFLV